MEKLQLNNSEVMKLETILSSMEMEFGNEYVFVPKENEYSCRCSGPAQSCVWH